MLKQWWYCSIKVWEYAKVHSRTSRAVWFAIEEIWILPVKQFGEYSACWKPKTCCRICWHKCKLSHQQLPTEDRDRVIHTKIRYFSIPKPRITDIIHSERKSPRSDFSQYSIIADWSHTITREYGNVRIQEGHLQGVKEGLAFLTDKDQDSKTESNSPQAYEARFTVSVSLALQRTRNGNRRVLPLMIFYYPTHQKP